MDRDVVYGRIKLTLIIVFCSMIGLLAIVAAMWLIGYNAAATEAERSPFDIEGFVVTHKLLIDLLAAFLIVPLAALMAEGFFLSDRRFTRRRAWTEGLARRFSKST